MKKLLIGLIIGLSLGAFGCSYANKTVQTESSNIAPTQNIQPTESTASYALPKQNNQLKYFFSQTPGQHPDQELIKVINSAQNSLDIAIYSITKKEIVDSIISAKNRGVSIRIITDKQEAATKAQKQELSLLKASGVPIRKNTHKGLMHMKVTIADGKVATTGSYNYSNGATFDNDEVFVVINDTKAAQDFESQFERMWKDNKNFKDM
jgi:phosphatidylserine/phosphatidylglycerophosphate/cardiolipin synthase-like enzyme